MKTRLFALAILALLGCASTQKHLNARMNETVQAGQKPFKDCYEKFGADQDVTTFVKYELGKSGAVEKIEIDPAQSVNSTSAMNDCVVKAFKALAPLKLDGRESVLGTYKFHYTR